MEWPNTRDTPKHIKYERNATQGRLGITCAGACCPGRALPLPPAHPQPRKAPVVTEMLQCLGVSDRTSRVYLQYIYKR